MKTFLYTAVLAAAALVTSPVLLAEEKAPSTQPAAKPVNEYCPVNPDGKANPEVTYDWDGKIVAFCCGGCIDEFKANPTKYADKLK